MLTETFNSTKWWWQIVPSARSSHSERAVTKWWRGTWHCDRARRGGSEACSDSRCGRRRDGVGRITWCFAMQATINSHAQLVLTRVLDRKPKMIAKQTGNVVPPGRAGQQTNNSVENGLQALNVAVGETSEYNVTVVKPIVYQGSDQSGQCACRQRPLDGFNLPQSTEIGR